MNDKWMLDGNKLLFHMDRVERMLKGERIYPILIDIGLTKFCNAKCSYCYGAYQKMSSEFIPGDVLVRLFSDAPRLGVKAITMTGDGEPTLHPACHLACITGFNGGLDIGMATNGIDFRGHLVTYLETLTWMRFNISAGSRESYKKVHGVDKFEEVMAHVETAVKLRRGGRPTIGIQMVLVPECLGDVVPLARRAVELGVDYFVIKQFSDPGSEVPCGSFDHDKFVREAIPVLKEAEGLSNECTSIVPKYTLINLANRKPYPKCIDLPLLFQISGNSKCYPCGYLFNKEEYCYGDLKEKSFQEIIESERYWEVIERIKKMDVNELCKGCCRHDSTNMFMTRLVNRPDHINFI